MQSSYSSKIYGSWKDAQLEKYTDVFAMISKHLNSDMTALDFGIGPAWFHDFLEEKGLKFKKVVGIDPDLTVEKKPHIEYYTSLSNVNEKFDFVIAFDSVHLTEVHLMNHVKDNGFLLVSIPLKFKPSLNNLKGKIIEQGEIGSREKDYFLFIQKT